MLPDRLNPRGVQLPRALFTAEQVRELDRQAIGSGIAGFELMTRAGRAAFTLIQQRWAHCSPVEVFCGGGNNGGDGYVVAALAAEAGIPVRVWALSDKLKGDALTAKAWAQNSGVAITPWAGQSPAAGSIVVDAMLGTGLSGAVRARYAEAIAVINASPAPVIAVDTPSGLCSDTGRLLGEAARAQATMTFIGLKRGLFTAAAAEVVGELVFDDLQVPRDILDAMPPSALRADYRDIALALSPRSPTAHKGRFGHVLVVGGDNGMAGAALLSASAAGRCGAGLVSCATRAAHIPALVAARPEIMAHAVDSDDALAPLLARASVVAAGPGLGQAEWGRVLLSAVLASDLPAVVDADALNLVASKQVDLGAEHAARIITPHPGEAARLLACDVEEIQADRFAAARELNRRYGAVVLLKGAGTLICDGAQSWVIGGGNPGMASGGMGDVLTGVIAALLAQHLPPADAARIGAAVHNLAADLAASEGQRGTLAGDVVANIRKAVNGITAVNGIEVASG